MLRVFEEARPTDCRVARGEPRLDRAESFEGNVLEDVNAHRA